MGGVFDGRPALDNILGLTKNGERLSEKEHDIVCKPSVNAMIDRRQIIVNDVRKQTAHWFGQNGFSDLGQIMADFRVEHQFFGDPNYVGRIDGNTLARDGKSLKMVLGQMEGYEKIPVCQEEFESLLQKLSEVQDADSSVGSEGVQTSTVFKSLSSFILEQADRGLERLKGTYTNPFLTLQDNSKTHLHQSVFYRPVPQPDGRLKNTLTGTNFCAMNSILNGLKANPKANKQKVLDLFSENGCKLHYKYAVKQGDKTVEQSMQFEYSYDAAEIKKTGETGYFEQTLNKHLTACYGQGDYQATDVSRMADILGMKSVSSPELDSLAFGLIQLDAFAVQLNAHLNEGSVLVLTENRPPAEGGLHNVAVKSVEYLQDGTVKMSIVDDVPNGKNPGNPYEYERVYTAAQLKDLANLQISVVSFPAQIQ